jgi:hypothetical protein
VDLLEGLSVREVAAAQGMSRSWVYECLARCRAVAAPAATRPLAAAGATCRRSASRATRSRMSTSGSSARTWSRAADEREQEAPWPSSARSSANIGTTATSSLPWFIFPLIFLIHPLLTVLSQSASRSNGLAQEHVLLYMLAIPALVPAELASYSVVGERQQAPLSPCSRRRSAARVSAGQGAGGIRPVARDLHAVLAFPRLRGAVRTSGYSAGTQRGPGSGCPAASRQSSPHGRSTSASRSRPDRATYAS